MPPTTTKTQTSATPGRLILAGLAGGLETTCALWVLWLATHLPALKSTQGPTTPEAPTLILLGVALIASVALGCLGMPKRARPVAGLLAGLTTAVLNLLMLGSMLGETADTPGALADVANIFRDNALGIVLGFVGACTAGGLAAGSIALALPLGRTTCPTATTLNARLATPVLAMLLCLIALGGAVTGADAGLAVPDAVTTYGSLPWLYPLELMADPRIFLEHSHRLFGWLAGVSALTLAITTLIVHPRTWWLGLGIGLGLLILTSAAIGMGHAGVLGQTASIALAGLVAVVLLVWTATAAMRGNVGHAAFGLGCLIATQAVFGIVRVSEQLTWVAALHGLYAQAILAAAAMLLVKLRLAASPTPRDPERSAGRVGWITLAVLGLQVVLGAGTRHFAHPALTGLHILWSLAAVAMVVIYGIFLSRSARPEEGKPSPSKLLGIGLHAIVSVQFLLGWWALAMVGHGSSGELPTPETLTEAAPIPTMEAVVTTAHQAIGALLVGCTAAGLALGVYPMRRAGSPADEATGASQPPETD